MEEKTEMEVPASKSIKRNRAHNVDTDRLLRRQEFLVNMIKNSNSFFEARYDFAVKALELHAIENVLEDRQAISTRNTVRQQESQVA
jgi:hypothetical protein